jgi:hypothetical protein
MSQDRKYMTLIGPDGRVMSRRVFLGCSLLGAAGVGAGVFSSPAAARGTGPGKVSKATARYQERPRGEQRCARCAHFQAPNRCEIVAGRISPNGWSRFFERA